MTEELSFTRDGEIDGSGTEQAEWHGGRMGPPEQVADQSDPIKSFVDSAYLDKQESFLPPKEDAQPRGESPFPWQENGAWRLPVPHPMTSVPDISINLSITDPNKAIIKVTWSGAFDGCGGATLMPGDMSDAQAALDHAQMMAKIVQQMVVRNGLDSKTVSERFEREARQQAAENEAFAAERKQEYGSYDPAKPGYHPECHVCHGSMRAPSRKEGFDKETCYRCFPAQEASPFVPPKPSAFQGWSPLPNCTVCGGSGLVHPEGKNPITCPKCGPAEWREFVPKSAELPIIAST